MTSRPMRTGDHGLLSPAPGPACEDTVGSPQVGRGPPRTKGLRQLDRGLLTLQNHEKSGLLRKPHLLTSVWQLELRQESS